MGLISKVKDALHGDHEKSEIDSASTRTIASTSEVPVVARTNTTVESAAAAANTTTTGHRATGEINTSTLLPPKEVNVVDKGVVHEETHVAPAVVQEKIHRAHHEEITPVVDRQTEQVQVNQKLQPVVDKQQDYRHDERVNAAISNEVVDAIPEGDSAIYQNNLNAVKDTRQVGDLKKTANINAPIVNETVQKHIVNEIQPVIQREIDQRSTLHTTQPIHEHHVAAPKVGELRVEAPISIEEFQAKSKNTTTSTATHGIAAINTANVREP